MFDVYAGAVVIHCSSVCYGDEVVGKLARKGMSSNGVLSVCEYCVGSHLADSKPYLKV